MVPMLPDAGNEAPAVALVRASVDAAGAVAVAVVRNNEGSSRRAGLLLESQLAAKCLNHGVECSNPYVIKSTSFVTTCQNMSPRKKYKLLTIAFFEAPSCRKCLSCVADTWVQWRVVVVRTCSDMTVYLPVSACLCLCENVSVRLCVCVVLAVLVVVVVVCIW